MKVSLIQVNATDDKAHNLSQAESLVRETASRDTPRLIVLPENFNYLGGTTASSREAAETFPQGESYQLMQDLACELRVFLHAGSMIERDGDDIYNTSVVFNPSGEEIARYRKLHLFDIEGPDGSVYKESRLFSRGREIVTYRIDGYTFGCSICYDIRFPELYARLVDAGADVILIPAAFTLMTGKDHWEVLCRARAIETQTYVLAAGQIGAYVEDGEERRKFGASMIVSPWGTPLARAEDRVGTVSAWIDLEYLKVVRSRIPVREHRVLR